MWMKEFRRSYELPYGSDLFKFRVEMLDGFYNCINDIEYNHTNLDGIIYCIQRLPDLDFGSYYYIYVHQLPPNFVKL